MESLLGVGTSAVDKAWLRGMKGSKPSSYLAHSASARGHVGCLQASFYLSSSQRGSLLYYLEGRKWFFLPLRGEPEPEAEV